MASGIVHSASMSSTITANNEPLLPVVAPGDAPLTTTSSTATAEPNNGGGGASSSNNNNNNNNNNNSLPRPPSILAESRDTSLSSRNTRDSLRKSVTMRSGSFTESERLFLEQLTVEGTDREVETALRVVEDPDNEDLFFFGSQEQQQQQQQDTKGAGRKREEEDGYEYDNDNDNDDIGLNVSLEDDATRDGVAASVATTERRGLESSTATSTITATATATATTTTNITATTTTTATTTSSLTSSSILGSQRRREVLERRRSESSYNLATIWRAHQTGLAITHSGSRRSLLRRESSISSIGTNASGSGLSVVFGTKAHPGAVRDDVFRSDNNSKSNNNNYNNNNNSNSNSNSNSNRTENDQNKPPRGSFSTPPKKIKPKQPRSLPTRRPPPFRRSKSVTIAMLSPRKGLARIPEPKTFDPRALSAKPERHRRTQSVSIQRKSVTFHHIDEELEFDSNKATAAIDAIDAVDTAAKRPAALRRSVSDSQIAHPGESKTDQPSLSSSTAAAAIRKPAAAKDAQQHRRALLKRESSMNSIPSIRHGAPVRQDSISSIPSLHHGNPLRDSMSVLGRQSSTASFPSLHPGNPLHDSMSTMFEGDASVATFASLHHGNPLHDSVSPMGRRTSTASFPSLHHGNPLHDSMSTMGRQTSIASIPSIHHGNPLHDSMSTMTQQGASFASLRHANPIRQESVSTIPSLHHARPIRLDSVASLALSSRPSPMSQDAITQRFGVSDEVALAWVQSDESKDKEDAKKTASVPTSTYYDCTRSIPHNVTMPTVASSTDWEENEKGKEELSSLSKSTEDPSSVSVPKPVLMRQATRNTYEGEGVEVQELCQTPILDDEATETQTGPIIDAPLSESDSYYHQYRPEPNVFRTMSLFTNSSGMIRTAGSFDDISLFSSFGKQQRTSDVFRDLRRSLSDENMSTISTMFDQHKEFLLQIPTASDGQSETFEDEISDNGSTSWEMEFSSPNGRFDAWNILQDDYANGYGGAGTLGFRILGTSADDESCQPHVLSPPLMESLQAFLPCAKSGQNFYMKYSMIRDGASLQTLLRRARGVNYSILAIETIDGEVFGSFTGQAWRKSWNYFGTGESFLWRMRHSRLEPTNGILEQAQKESEIDVYPYTGENGFIQLCTHDRIAVGGGMPDETETSGEKKFNEPGSPLVENSHDWGFGLALQSDLLQGSSSPCVTFGSPSLCKAQPSGSRFEVINVELWTTTPCMTEEDAERLELGKLFLGGNSSNDSLNDAYLPGNYTY